MYDLINAFVDQSSSTMCNDLKSFVGAIFYKFVTNDFKIKCMPSFIKWKALGEAIGTV